MEKLQTASLDVAEERVAWEGMASACSPPLRRLGAFLLLAFAVFIATTTGVALFYTLFGAHPEAAGQSVPYSQGVFQASAAFSLVLGLGGYLAWLLRSLRVYKVSSKVLIRGGLDPKRPTAGGLRAYSDEQLLALRSRYENLKDGRLKDLFEAVFGFHADDSFALGPLSVLPGTFEMGALRVEWEVNLILRSSQPRPEIGWWAEGRYSVLPRRTEETRRLVYALKYTQDSVRALKRRYGYHTARWHATVPEGKLWDAVRDYEDARRIQAALRRKSRLR